MLTITARLTFWYLAVFGSIIIVIAVVTYTARDSWESNVVDNELRHYAGNLVARSLNGKNDPADFFAQLRGAAEQSDLRYRSMGFLLATERQVYFEDTLLGEISPMQFAPPPGVEGDAPRYRTLTLHGSSYRSFSMKVPDSIVKDAHLMVFVSLEPLEERLGRLRILFLIIVPAALLVASAGGWFIARRALSPVTEMTNAAALISSRNFHQRVPVGRTRDELAHLAVTFNDMITRLETTFRGQRRFVADASHDLRTPLTIIQAEVELILKRDDIDAETREALMRVAGEVERLNRLAGDLLLLAKVDAQQLSTLKQPVRLDELIVECVRQLRTLAEKKSVMMRVMIDDPVEVVGDPHMLQRALTNILDNAIKYTPDGGVVLVSLTARGGRATIEIRDNGEGIGEEEISKVFERFYRGDRSRSTSGSGLGLAIAHAIIDAVGGNLSISSQLGMGTAVRIGLVRRIDD